MSAAPDVPPLDLCCPCCMQPVPEQVWQDGPTRGYQANRFRMQMEVYLHKYKARYRELILAREAAGRVLYPARGGPKRPRVELVRHVMGITPDGVHGADGGEAVGELGPGAATALALPLEDGEIPNGYDVHHAAIADWAMSEERARLKGYPSSQELRREPSAEVTPASLVAS